MDQQKVSETDSSIYRTVVSKSNGQYSPIVYEIKLRGGAGGKNTVYVSVNGSRPTFYGATQVGTNEWNHLVLVF